MRLAMSLLMFGLVLQGCDDDSRTPGLTDLGPSGSDSGASALPGPIRGLGATAGDCVDWCRTAVGDCSRVIIFIDRSEGCSGDECDLTSVDCAASCSRSADITATLEASGCESEWRAYEACVGMVESASPGLCQVTDSDCGIEWGVYKGCTGL